MNTDTAEAWIPTDADFGSRLALIRHRMSWNIKEAARECGLPAATWRLWEVEGSTPRNLITVAMAISQRVGCDYLWLVHGPGRGGSVRPTTGFAGSARVLATLGNDPLPHAGHHRPSTRPVRQTRPMRPDVRRPMTPVAV